MSERDGMNEVKRYDFHVLEDDMVEMAYGNSRAVPRYRQGGKPMKVRCDTCGEWRTEGGRCEWCGK